MSNLARLILLKNIEGITSKTSAERIVRLEVENIRLKHNIEIDGVKYYLCGTNIGYSLEKENSPVFKRFIRRQLKRLETSEKISKSISDFIQR
jgi:DNA-binding HxlR family transcriptional regulator